MKNILALLTFLLCSILCCLGTINNDNIFTKAENISEKFVNVDRLSELFSTGNFANMENEAKIMLNDTRDTSTWLRIANYLYMSLHAQYKFDEALKLLDNAIEKEKEDSLRYYDVQNYIAMMDIFDAIGYNEIADSCLSMASKMSGGINKCTLEKRILTMGMLYIARSKQNLSNNDFGGALKEWQAAKQYSNQKSIHNIWLGHGGYIYEQMGDSTTADFYFLKVLENGYSSTNALVCLVHCMAYRNKRGLFNESLKLLDKHSDLINYSNSPQLRKYLMLATGEALAQSGDMKNAAVMFYRANLLSDSLSEIDKINRNQILMKSINPANYSSLKMKVNALSKRNATIVIFLSLFGFVGIIILQRMLHKQLLHRKQNHSLTMLNHWNSIKNKIQIDFLQDRYCQNKDDLISSSYEISKMKAKFEDIRKETENSKPPHEKIGSIRLLIREAISSKNDLSDFTFRFKKEYKDFVNQLTNMHPNLTKTEITMCCYILTGMTGKEIASFTNRSPRTIDAIRYNLRKKLGIKCSTESYMRQIAAMTSEQSNDYIKNQDKL